METGNFIVVNGSLETQARSIDKEDQKKVIWLI